MDKNFILKANLFEQGIKVSSKAQEILDKQSDIWLMKDYITCSGVTLHYKNEYATVNVVDESMFELISNDNNFYIKLPNNEKILTTIITPPDYMKDELIIGEKNITVYCNTYTDRVRLQLISGCSYSCKFCNAKEFKYEFNKIEYLEESLKIALSQSDVHHVLVSSGSVRVEDLPKLTEMYEYFGKKYSYLGIELMMAPREFTSYDNDTLYEEYIKHLKDFGFRKLSINMELNDPVYLRRFCPEKADIGQEKYLKFIQLAVEIFGVNNVRSLLIVGLEPIEETLKGVEKLASIGCNPVLSPLFPYGEANNKPNADLFIKVREESEKICKKYNIELGPLCKPCSHNTL